MVAHRIQTKDKAVKKCVDCHSKNSMLMASLYKFKAQENRKSYGFLNAAMLGDTYIIGANRNTYLNALSVTVFSLVMLLIFIHIVFRILTK